jgi:hypothetical protein
MGDKPQITLLILLGILFMSGTGWAQINTQSRTLVINGKAGDAAIVRVNGRTYVELEALVSIGDGSLSFQNDQIILTLPSSTMNASGMPPQPAHGDDSAFSRDFMTAAIEAISLMREWASPLANALQNGYPVTESWANGYRERAAQGVRLASVATSTAADKSGMKLLTNEFEAVREWSAKLVEARKSMNAAKYAMSPTALLDEPLSQKIVACAHFLAPMLASGTFQDDSSCH